MKTLSIFIGSTLLLLNIIIGLMLSEYHTFNWILNSAIIVAFVAIQCIVSSITLKDGYRISLNCLVPFITFIELVCGCVAGQKFEDNLPIVIILTLIVLEIIILISTNYLSKHIN